MELSIKGQHFFIIHYFLTMLSDNKKYSFLEVMETLSGTKNLLRMVGLCYFTQPKSRKSLTLETHFFCPSLLPTRFFAKHLKGDEPYGISKCLAVFTKI